MGSGSFIFPKGTLSKLLLVKYPFSTVTQENWRQAVKHAEKLQEENAERDITL